MLTVSKDLLPSCNHPTSAGQSNTDTDGISSVNVFLRADAKMIDAVVVVRNRIAA